MVKVSRHVMCLNNCVLSVVGMVLAAALPAIAADTSKYEKLRQELRAFYPDECHGACKLAAQTNSVQLIARGIDESAIGGALGYVRRPGEHGMAADEWRRLMDFSDKIFSAR